MKCAHLIGQSQARGGVRAPLRIAGERVAERAEREIFGERLFPLVFALEPEMAFRVTGMPARSHTLAAFARNTLCVIEALLHTRIPRARVQIIPYILYAVEREKATIVKSFRVHFCRTIMKTSGDLRCQRVCTCILHEVELSACACVVVCIQACCSS